MLVNASGRPTRRKPPISTASITRWCGSLWCLRWLRAELAAAASGRHTRLYGAWHHVMTGMLQHGGLADNVTDHRLNTCTVMMNPVCVIYNMNIMWTTYPKVPYHALPELHAMVRHDLPPPSPSIAAGFAEMWPALVRQLRNEDYFVRREPETATPIANLPERRHRRQGTAPRPC